VLLESAYSGWDYLPAKYALHKVLLGRIWPPPILPSWVLRSCLSLFINSLSQRIAEGQQYITTSNLAV